MTVRLTPSAKKRLQLIRKLALPMNGFVTGTVLGKFTLIKDLIPVQFEQQIFDDTYKKAFEQIGLELLGVFFFQMKPFASEWSYQDLVLTITPDKVKIDRCNIPE